MALADLTAEERILLDNYVTQLRAHAGEFQRWINTGMTLDASWNSGISALVLQIDPDVLPNASGLAGAFSLTETEIVNLQSYIQGMNTTYNTSGHQQTRQKAAGVNAVIGT